MIPKSDKKTRFPFGRKAEGGEYYKAVPLNEEGEPDEVATADKVKGAAQMAAGTAITAAGIPMLVLPGPGAAAIIGGAALTLKGHRTLTGRDPLPIEQSIDDAAQRLATVVKDEASAMGRKVANKATDVGTRIVEEGPSVVAATAKQVPDAVACAASRASEVASAVAQQAPAVAGTVGRAVARGSKIVVGVGAEVVRQGSNLVKEHRGAK